MFELLINYICYLIFNYYFAIENYKIAEEAFVKKIMQLSTILVQLII